ncbi:LysE family translocator [Lacibacterium aquatile]|uniref:LysE family translocator n=1 Tax=Lacibacterium aquatile TaxID=1168082 RepID=A0ABW5DVZ2_9PROT
MTLALILALATYAFVTSITPGPNNIMLAASGLRFGFWPTLPHMVGISVGFAVLMFVSGLGLGALFAAEPRLHAVLKIAGAAYLLYLAWKLWRAGAPGEATGAKPLGFFGAAAFQFVNPKAWIMALTAVASFIPEGEGFITSLLIGTAVFSLVNLPSVGVWAAFGAAIRRWLDNPTVLTWLNRSMAILTAACVVMILA